MDCVADALAYGVPPDEIQLPVSSPSQGEAVVTKICQTRRALTIYDNCQWLHFGKHVCVFLNEWSDDFEPSLSINSN